MAKPRRTERSRTARSSRQLRRFHHGITPGSGFRYTQVAQLGAVRERKIGKARVEQVRVAFGRIPNGQFTMTKLCGGSRSLLRPIVADAPRCTSLLIELR